MTNLYDFLRQILAEKDNQDKSQCGPQPVFLTNDQIEWIRHYLHEPEAMIQFKARKTGVVTIDGEPEYAQDYAIAGEPHEIFTLLTEAAMQIPVFCNMLFAAYGFMTEHVEKCEDCQAHLEKAREDFQNQVLDYTFKPHAK